MASTEYRVSLDAFEGPLDLLLFLIRRSEVDVADIPIARITEQYLAFLEAGGGIEKIDIELAGEFLVMAATLMEIKSRMLMPASVEPADGAPEAPAAPIDPRADLVRQLIEYKKYRDAAHALEGRRLAWESRFGSGPGGWSDATLPDDATVLDAAVEMDELDLVDLARAFASIIETVDFSRVGDHRVKDDETPIEIHAADILDRLVRDGGPERRMEFAAVFRGRTRSEAIGMFLALLELVRQRKIAARQDRINGAITVEVVPEDASALNP